LIKVSAVEGGSALLLDDGHLLMVDVSPERLDAAIIGQGCSPLIELIAARSLGVYVGMREMTADRWERVGRHLCRSAKFTALLEPFPDLLNAFQLPFSVIEKMAQRVYGGITDRSIYTSHPIDFRPDPNRNCSWLRGLLNARDGWLFETWVNLDTGEVEIEVFQLAGHFVE
jgi:hypothetical protein